MRKRNIPEARHCEGGALMARETAQIAFEAFMRIMGRNAWWNDLSLQEMDAWREASHEVLQKGWIEAQKPPHRKR
jgi:hypothetical protein